MSQSPGLTRSGYRRPVTDAVLSLSGVAVVRDRATLLADVDWTVREGERWVVLGPNGAGKTTLMQIASASLFPTRGRVELLGEVFGAVDLSELRTRVGISSAALGDRIPGHERAIDVVITASYGVLGRWQERYDAADTARAAELLARVGLRAFTDRRFGTLSEGERKRVLLARALMTDPELLLLDEPAAGLDLGAREALLRLLTRLAGDPGSPPTVLVTHHPEEVPVGTTHALLLARGRTVAAGPVREVLTAPRLSRAFGLPLVVEERDGRFTARAALN
ncbi:MAG: iron complex transport system ATP-binding protein [Actinomycetota bacterium]|nr:iron complex transport system ATP-binding protein [Actinomycetota bacterium]